MDCSFQVWAANAKINLGIVADDGSAFGVAGKPQGDSRFGDIRVGAVAMDSDAMAVSLPPDNGTTGTLSGDLLLNTQQPFTVESLYSVVLHEAGHIFGLDHSNSPDSPMYPVLHNAHSLLGSDVQSLQWLYGVKTRDLNELNASNDSIAKSTKIETIVGKDGKLTPAIIYGEISTKSDVDYFAINVPNSYSGPIKFHLKTSEVSLLDGELTVYNSKGKLVKTSIMPSGNGGDAYITIDQARSNETYFVKVAANLQGNVSTGRFGLSVTFVAQSATTGVSDSYVIRNTSEQLTPQQIDAVFRNPNVLIFDQELGRDDNLSDATELRSDKPNSSNFFQVAGSISSTKDLDLYHLRTPSSDSDWVLTLAINAEAINGVVPKVRLLDSSNREISTRIIANSEGLYVIEVEGIATGRDYYVELSSDGNVGNYDMQCRFGTAVTKQETFVEGGFEETSAYSQEYALFVARSQLFDFVLSGSGPVTMIISDLRGNEIYRLSSVDGRATSKLSALITPGEYRVLFIGQGASTYKLTGSRISDPIGPSYSNPSYSPDYQANPVQPVYLFPYAPTLPFSTPYSFVMYPYYTSYY